MLRVIPNPETLPETLLRRAPNGAQSRLDRPAPLQPERGSTDGSRALTRTAVPGLQESFARRTLNSIPPSIPGERGPGAGLPGVPERTRPRVSARDAALGPGEKSRRDGNSPTGESSPFRQAPARARRLPARGREDRRCRNASSTARRAPSGRRTSPTRHVRVSFYQRRHRFPLRGLDPRPTPFRLAPRSNSGRLCSSSRSAHSRGRSGTRRTDAEELARRRRPRGRHRSKGRRADPSGHLKTPAPDRVPGFTGREGPSTPTPGLPSDARRPSRTGGGDDVDHRLRGRRGRVRQDDSDGDGGSSAPADPSRPQVTRTDINTFITLSARSGPPATTDAHHAGHRTTGSTTGRRPRRSRTRQGEGAGLLRDRLRGDGHRRRDADDVPDADPRLRPQRPIGERSSRHRGTEADQGTNNCSSPTRRNGSPRTTRRMTHHSPIRVPGGSRGSAGDGNIVGHGRPRCTCAAAEPSRRDGGLPAGELPGACATGLARVLRGANREQPPARAIASIRGARSRLSTRGLSEEGGTSWRCCPKWQLSAGKPSPTSKLKERSRQYARRL